MIYLPEMSEKPAPDALFHAQYSHQGKYVIQWSAARDSDARAALKRLRVPAKNVRAESSATYLTPFAGGIFVGLVTSASHERLRDGDLTATAILLD